MTISSTVSRVSYSGNGVTTVFSFPYLFLVEADLIVVLRDALGVETTKTLTTHYTTSGAGVQSGGSVTMLTAPAVGETLVIYRNPSLTQDLDLVDGDPLPVEPVEKRLDKLTMFSQRLADQISRSLVQKETDSAVDLSIPLLADRVSMYAAYDSDGKPIAVTALSATLGATAFIQTLLDDTTAAIARTTLDAAQKTHSMTAKTTPVSTDEVGIYDTAGVAEKKVTLANFFDYVLLGANLAKTLRPGQTINIGLAQGSDSSKIKITGANGSVLSATNPGYVCLMSSATPGQKSVFTITADVSIDLTGSHYGIDTFGDFTDLQLRVYAVNDTEALKWMIALQGGLRTIASTSTSATATNVIAKKATGVCGLVSAALNAGTWPCTEVGWFNSDFTDSSNEHAVQNAVGDLNVGIIVPDKTDWVSYTPAWTGSGGNPAIGNGAISGRYKKDGEDLEIDIYLIYGSTSTAGTGTWQFGLPTGLSANILALASAGLTDTPVGQALIVDASVTTYFGTVSYGAPTFVFARFWNAGGTNVDTGASLAAAAPMTPATGDKIFLSRIRIPIVQWSSNGN